MISSLADQVVLVGPIDEKTMMYEYVFLSNWAKFPVIGLARDWRRFAQRFQRHTEQWLNNEGYLVDFNVRFSDWSRCERVTPENILKNIMNRFLFG